MKTVSQDKTYIDYTKGTFGIRVWRDRCQAIARTAGSTAWVFRESAKPLPIGDSFKNFPNRDTMHPVPAIALEIGRVGSGELEKLVSGEISFDDAISSQ
jgi:hypothetical protein